MIAAPLLVALLAADVGQANDTARSILADDKYGFCHDEQYPLTNAEAAWCPPVGPPQNPRCPAFKHACNAPRAELEQLGRLDFSRGVEGDGDTKGEARKSGDRSKRGAGDGRDGGNKPGDDKPGARETPDRDIVEPPTSTLQMPELGGFAYVLFWLVLGAGVLFLIYVIVRNSSKSSTEADAPAPEQLAEATPASTGPSEQVVRDVHTLLEQARAAAHAGDFIKAIRHTHAALLHRLDHDGLIRVAPSRTNGDYVADLKPKPELRTAVRDVVRDVEQVQFGAVPPDAGLFDRILTRVVPIATRRGDTLALLLGASLLSCTCTTIPKSYPYDLSPSGTRAVAELAEAHGGTLTFRSEPLADADLDERGRTLILLHDAFVDESTWTHLLAWADAGNTLVLAGITPPAALRLSIAHGDVGGHALAVAPEFTDPIGDLALVVPDDSHLLDADDPPATGERLLGRADGKLYAVVRDRGYAGGKLYVFADDRLFTNGALMLADNPQFVARLLTSLPAGPVELVDGLLDLGTDSPAETIENSHLTAAVLQLLVFITLLYLWRGVPFGAPRDPSARSRRHYTEHIDAVGQHYARARATRHAVRLYAGWAIDRLRDKTLGTRQPGLYALAQAIAGRTGDDEATVMQTLVEASSVRDDVDASNAIPNRARTQAATEDLQLMQALARLVHLVGGPR